MRAVCQFLLAVVCHFCILVVEEVIFQRGAQPGRELIACSHAEQRRHVVARTNTILIRSGVGTKLCLQSLQLGLGILRVGSHHGCYRGRSQSGIEHVGVVLGVDFRTELIAGRKRQRSLMVGQADNGREAPALLVNVEQ